MRPAFLFAPLVALVSCLSPPPAVASGSGDGGPTVSAVLPPALPWDGASRAVAMDPDTASEEALRWITPVEREGLARTPSYDETFAWLEELVAASDLLEMVSLGKSGEGRDLWMVVASADGAFTPEAMNEVRRERSKPIVLAQAGIHSGEIDGKDAGLMLLRNMTVPGTRDERPLLDRVQWLFVPIFNPDGHERRSPLGRINQRGPEEMGWRTNARNLNLNRDYAKADSPEMAAMLRAIGAWDPDLYIDLHVTDGMDYQYDITWGYGGEQSYSPAISRWLRTVLDPPVSAVLEQMGHFPGGLVFGVDPQNPAAGLFDWSAATPRFSDGYGAARHLPAILVENHSLKPYDQRVLGTYVFLTTVLDAVGHHGESLFAAVAQDRALRTPEVALRFGVDPEAEPETVDFLGVRWRHEASEVSGGQKVVWLGEPEDQTLPRVSPTVQATVKRPAAYWIPAAWTEVIGRLELHGVAMERIDAPRSVEVEMYRLTGTELAKAPFEGRVRLELTEEPEVERRLETYPAGSVRVSTDQTLGDLAVLLLEPGSPDSFVRWGFFHSVLSRTEYVEAYVMEPTGERMLAEDPELRKTFEAKLASDEAFAADPRARLQWLYQRSPFFDPKWRLYPVGREVPEPSADPAAAP
ncbi:MAG: M14 family metallopeptidase [Acidobacteriota bacterium]